MNRRRNSDGFVDFLLDHYQYLIVALLLVILIIVLIIFSVHQRRSSSSASNDKAASPGTEEAESSAQGQADPIDMPDVKFEQNAHEEVNSFFTRYYQAIASADFDAIESMGNVLDAEDRAKIQVKADYTEDYENMSCYTKPGPEDNSYLVCVYYEIKFVNIDTLAPGISTFLLCTRDNGELYLRDIGSLPQNMKDYISAFASQQDVQDLLTEVDALYQNNIDSDPTLGAFMISLQTKVNSAAAKAAAGETTSSNETEESPENEISEVMVTTTDTVNVRATPDTSGERVGQVAKGVSLVRISEEGEWSKVRYQDTEAYIKSEFLTTAEGNTAVAGQIQDGTETSSELTTASGQVKANEACSVRADATTDAQKIGSAHKGDVFTLTGEKNGWVQIDFNGQTGYIRGDLVTKQ